MSYFSFWKDTLLREIVRREYAFPPLFSWSKLALLYELFKFFPYRVESFSIKFLSSLTAIKSDDIVHTLQALNCLHGLSNGSVIIKVPPKLREVCYILFYGVFLLYWL